MWLNGVSISERVIGRLFGKLEEKRDMKSVGFPLGEGQKEWGRNRARMGVL